MKRLTQTLPLILAAALQLVPLLRNLVTSPAAGSSFAFILRWGLGTAAALETVDAVSGASLPVTFSSPTNFSGTTGIYFSNNVTIANNKQDPGAFFVLSNSLGTTSALINGNTTTTCMPPGLTFKCVDLNDGNNQTPNPIYGAIYGTNTTGATNFMINVSCGHPSYLGTISTNIYITILPAVSGSPPVITNQPVSVATNVGNNVTLSVTDGGTAPFKYQWYFNTNTPLLNATNVSLTLTNVQLTNSGYYRVAITNSAGSTNSANALLTIWQPPVITNQPVNFTNVAGGNATFGVVAGGVPTPSYQWKLNASTILTNATGISLTLTNLRASQAGTYSVTITNAGGATNSFQATLVVTNPLPTTLTAPVNSGGLFSFTFIPTVGLTNSVLTNGVLTGGVWSVLTNVPPPASASPVTVTDSLGTSNRFYRVQILP